MNICNRHNKQNIYKDTDSNPRCDECLEIVANYYLFETEFRGSYEQAEEEILESWDDL